MSNVQVKAVDLTKEYKMGTQKVCALDNINLTVEQGAFTAIVGTSGSGKSTLLHLLGGLDKPTSGDVYIDSVKITDINEKDLSKIRREHIGFVFQKFCLIQELNVTENIVLPILLSNRKPDNNYIGELCDILGLSERKNHLPSELSGGQQQRVAIARALSNDPKLILCDEPTGNLDKKTGAEVIELLRKINRKFGKTVLVVTHDMSIAKEADRQIQIEDGRIVDVK